MSNKNTSSTLWMTFSGRLLGLTFFWTLVRTSHFWIFVKTDLSHVCENKVNMLRTFNRLSLTLSKQAEQVLAIRPTFWGWNRKPKQECNRKCGPAAVPYLRRRIWFVLGFRFGGWVRWGRQTYAGFGQNCQKRNTCKLVQKYALFCL